MADSPQEKSLHEAYRALVQCEAELSKIRDIVKAAGKTQHEGYIAFLKIKDVITDHDED